MSTIFYSWQSDRPPSICRSFIKDALESAIKTVSLELALEEAIRLDQDTAGVPGSPGIAESILKKIDDCAMFVADLTAVTTNDEREKAPNPNVLIEYGYALKVVGVNRIIGVMNEAYGVADETLPFDLKHRRWPIRYRLSPDDSGGVKHDQKEKLVSSLISALRTAFESGLFRQVVLRFSEVEPPWNNSSFLKNGDSLGRTDDDPSLPITWQNKPQVFLRLNPSDPVDFTGLQLQRMIMKDGLQPFGSESGSRFIVRNEWGAATVWARKDAKAYFGECVTQVFTDGVIWGIDSHTLNQVSDNGKNIPAKYLEREFVSSLSQYINFASMNLKLKPPFKFIVGLSGIKEYPIAIGGSEIGGYCTKPEIVFKGTVDSLQFDPVKLLTPFFIELWETCGYERPIR